MNHFVAIGLGLIAVGIFALAWRDATAADREDDARELARQHLQDEKDRSP